MAIAANDVRPFFQVVVFRTPEGFHFSELKKSIKTYIRSKNKGARNEFKLERAELPDDNPCAWHYTHKSPPSWYRYKREGRTDPGLRNLENDLLIIYQADNYLFVHAGCEKLLERASFAIRQFRVDGNPIPNVDARIIKRVLDNSEVRFSSVGIDNIFNPGGTAPEAKAYHGRAANLCVTPSFDAGFGVSYCLGRDLSSQSTPFGCSVNKKKIWRTWVDNIDEFTLKCDQVVEMMNRNAVRSYLDVLAEPIAPFPINQDQIVMFYMDYTSQKGSVFLQLGDHQFGDWAADLDPESSDIVKITLLGTGAPDQPIDLSFRYDNETRRWSFGTDGETDLTVVIEDEDGNYSRPVPIKRYLEERGGYTVLFTEGRAYRNGTFWKDSRFSQKFRHCNITEIPDWKGVDIKKEAAPPDKCYGRQNILERLKDCLTAHEYTYVIRDDGANEIADYVLISQSRIILAHAKASVTRNPGLDVGNLQVVCSQAIKNLRFFIADQYTDTIWERLQNPTRLTRDGSLAAQTPDQFKELYKSLLRDRSITKECWIVQPGISKAQLDGADASNKIHCLLNFVESACRASDVGFQLICSDT